MKFHNPNKRKPFGRPTWYKDRLYRSDHEAHVAAFLDLIGWVCEHELTPDNTHGYIPDFYVVRPELFLIEVKASTEEFKDAAAKVLASGWTGRFVILFRPDEYLGYLPPLPTDWVAQWNEAANLVMWEPKNRRHSRVVAQPNPKPVRLAQLPTEALRHYDVVPPMAVPPAIVTQNKQRCIRN